MSDKKEPKEGKDTVTFKEALEISFKMYWKRGKRIQVDFGHCFPL